MELVCRRIPAGKAATYGQIALLCGMPRNARQVGYALRSQRVGREICAHRIVNAKGILSGAEAFETPDMQRLLLAQEGVAARKTPEGWRVDLKICGWKHTLADAEELRAIFRREGI